MNNGSESKAIQLAQRTGRPDLISAQPSRVDVPLDGGSPFQPSGHELRRLKQVMSGRWNWAVAAVLTGSVLGGFLGIRSGRTIYSSVGQIRVVAVVPKVLYAVEDKDVPQMFDSFVESQVALLQSQRVMELAAQDPAWHALGRSSSDSAVQNLMHSIDVIHSGELITVKASDTDPNVAVTTVRAVIGAFEKIYEESDAQSNEKRLVVLQNIQATKGNELAAIREEISNIARPYGTDDLQPLFTMKQSAVEKLENSISDTEADLANAARSRAGHHGPDQLTAEQWAAVSPDMAALVHDRSVTQRNLEMLRAQNLLDNSKPVISAKAQLSVDATAIQDLAIQLQSQRAAGLLVMPNSENARGSDNHRVMMDPDTLREEVDSLRKRRDAAKAEMIAVGDQQLKISDLKYKADQAIRDRDAAQQRIDQLNTEATINGRVAIVSAGDRPLAPSKDTHLIFAAGGTFAGGIIGFGVILGLALFDRRLRSPDETGSIAPELTLLGLLPRLPDDLAGTAHDARAAHCVTGVRNLLQVWGRTANRRTFVITSPVAGAGKTSLTFALGVSYATARFKTLMIDCDLVGGGLTARADKIITLKLGDLLQQEGFLNEEQLADALAHAKDRARRLGEIVVERGWASQADLDRLLIKQREESVGLLNALDGTPLDQCVTNAGVPNLTLLPLGKAGSRHVALLSVQTLRELVEAASKQYDVVLIDTGPVPGSLEAQLAAAVADGVVLVVSPGVKRPLLLNCIDRLNDLGAKVAGLVYNRASDAQVFVYTSGTQSRVNAPIEMQLNSADPNGKSKRLSDKFGPLASAVSRAAPIPAPSRPVETLNAKIEAAPADHVD